MSKKQTLIRTLLAATTTMVQGGLSETSRRCGKPTCHARTMPRGRHGPHLYLTYREDGASRSLYVPPEHADGARGANGLGDVLEDRLRHRGVESGDVAATLAGAGVADAAAPEGRR